MIAINGKGTTIQQQEAPSTDDGLSMELLSASGSLRAPEIAPMERLAFTLTSYLEAIGINKAPVEIERSITPIIYQTLLQTASLEELEDSSDWIPFLGMTTLPDSASLSELLESAINQDAHILAQAAPRIAEALCDTQSETVDCALFLVDLASHWDEFLVGDFNAIHAQNSKR